MKKVLVAFDGHHFSEGALEFARKLNEKNPLVLVGVFLPQVDYSALWSHSGGGKAGSSNWSARSASGRPCAEPARERSGKPAGQRIHDVRPSRRLDTITSKPPGGAACSRSGSGLCAQVNAMKKHVKEPARQTMMPATLSMSCMRCIVEFFVLRSIGFGVVLVTILPR